ncbi:uncharacterized protein [Diabrotica undecimpunctata]|uniref:uncharacterized protein n=1 Tax=Diabrotica undecimpunctata TaxID=50387 RepID=UPI003B63F38B
MNCKNNCNMLVKMLLIVLVLDVVNSAAIYQNLHELTQAIQNLPSRTPLSIPSLEQQIRKKDVIPISSPNVVQTKTELSTPGETAVAVNYRSIFFAVGSIAALIIALLIPVQICYLSESCQNFVRNNFVFNERRKRDLEYVETILVALLDNFVEQDLRDDKGDHIQEIARPLYTEPLLITLSKYFDKYADREVKKHVKALIFILTHIVGKVFAIFQYFVAFLASYGIL